LDYSHRAGIVHRDIKPGNVMLTPQGQVKVMDFGIARAVADTSSTMTQTAAVIGTAQYLSPEQARGETVDARSDLYSTGCLLYELLVGRPPFVGESPVSVAYQHVREEPVPPSEFDPDIPPEVDAVVLKALTKNREHRYQSASEMRQDIHRVLSGQQVTAPMAAVAETRSMPSTVAPTAVAAADAYGQPQADGLLPGDGNNELQEARSRRNRGLAFFLLGLAIVAVAVGAYAIFTNLNGNTDTPAAPVQVAVPSVTGKTVAEATTLLTQKGLNLTSTTQSNNDVPVGKIVKQNPGMNVMVDKDSTVAVVVSGGPGLYSVPDVTGKTESQARTQLEKAPGNFQVATNSKTQDDPAPAGQVLSISPDPAQKYQAGQLFTLTVSTGNVKVLVPDVTAQSKDDATNALKRLGLNVGVTQEPDANTPEGYVIKQSIKGTKVDKGTKVIITIAVKPVETTPAPTTSPTTPSGDPSGDPSPTITLPGSGGNGGFRGRPAPGIR
jgi:eukaryotic-like serine/threonine-protein kinase